MEIKELRIGNFIDRNGLMEVKGINLTTVRVYDHYNKCSISHGFPVYSFKGIELTPEWLKACAITPIRDTASEYRLPIRACVDQLRFELVWGTGALIFKVHGGHVCLAECKYLHHLQNLFYSLTGEELAIDKTSLI